MPKAEVTTTPAGTFVTFRCPGCMGLHGALPVTGPRAWGWNGDVERPTLTPSVRVSTTRPQGDAMVERTLCHSFVTGGRIQFLSDCAHELAGQTVDLPDV